jgi:hypothetical protein
MSPSPAASYCKAADGLYHRLRILRRFHEAAAERGEEVLELQRRELWEPADEAALQEFEAARHALIGAVPLPLES